MASKKTHPEHGRPPPGSSSGAGRIVWQVRPSAPNGAKSAPCAHVRPGTLSDPAPVLIAQVVTTDAGSRRVLHRFGVAIGACCAGAPSAALARLTFWAAVRSSWSRAPLALALDGEQLERELAARVVLPSADEWTMWRSYQSQATTLAMCSPHERPWRSWLAWTQVQQRFATYQREQRQGETFSAWELRTPVGTAPPPRGARPKQPPPFDPPPFEVYPFRPARPPAAALRVLGLRWPCGEPDVRTAWKRAAAKAHPDAPGGSHEAFLAVTAARDEVLAAV